MQAVGCPGQLLYDGAVVALEPELPYLARDSGAVGRDEDAGVRAEGDGRVGAAPAVVARALEDLLSVGVEERAAGAVRALHEARLVAPAVTNPRCLRVAGRGLAVHGLRVVRQRHGGAGVPDAGRCLDGVRVRVRAGAAGLPTPFRGQRSRRVIALRAPAARGDGDGRVRCGGRGELVRGGPVGGLQRCAGATGGALRRRQGAGGETGEGESGAVAAAVGLGDGGVVDDDADLGGTGLGTAQSDQKAGVGAGTQRLCAGGKLDAHPEAPLPLADATHTGNEPALAGLLWRATVCEPACGQAGLVVL